MCGMMRWVFFCVAQCDKVFAVLILLRFQDIVLVSWTVGDRCVVMIVLMEFDRVLRVFVVLRWLSIVCLRWCGWWWSGFSVVRWRGGEL